MGLFAFALLALIRFQSPPEDETESDPVNAGIHVIVRNDPGFLLQSVFVLDGDPPTELTATPRAGEGSDVDFAPHEALQEGESGVMLWLLPARGQYPQFVSIIVPTFVFSGECKELFIDLNNYFGTLSGIVAPRNCSCTHAKFKLGDHGSAEDPELTCSWSMEYGQPFRFEGVPVGRSQIELICCRTYPLGDYLLNPGGNILPDSVNAMPSVEVAFGMYDCDAQGKIWIPTLVSEAPDGRSRFRLPQPALDDGGSLVWQSVPAGRYVMRSKGNPLADRSDLMFEVQSKAVRIDRSQRLVPSLDALLASQMELAADAFSLRVFPEMPELGPLFARRGDAQQAAKCFEELKQIRFDRQNYIIWATSNRVRREYLVRQNNESAELVPVGTTLEVRAKATFQASEWLGRLHFYVFDEYGQMEYPFSDYPGSSGFSYNYWKESSGWLFRYQLSGVDVGVGRRLLIVEDPLGRTVIDWLDFDDKDTDHQRELGVEQFRWVTVNDRLSDVNWRRR